jgi:hypothetical protein
MNRVPVQKAEMLITRKTCAAADMKNFEKAEIKLLE